MDLTRRTLFRSAGVVGAAAVVGGASGLAAEAVAGVAPTHTTAQFTIRTGKADAKGWRPLVTGPAEEHVVRTDLGAPAKKGRAKRRTPVLVFAQLSDVHIVDAQSPARVENGEVASSSAYRPQEVLTAHIAEAMVRRLNRVTGPVTGLRPALAIQTGDNSDNSQYNEIRWNIDLLDGGQITPDSGDLTRYEGVMDNAKDYYTTSFWHPHGTPKGKADDLYRKTYGFPVVPGLLDRCREPFTAHGLDMPWFTAFGNHDQLAQGNFQHNAQWNSLATGDQKDVILPNGSFGKRTVTADPDRRMLSKQEWIEEHFDSPATPGPVGHGFTEGNRADGTGYYAADQGLVRFLVLDSVHDYTDRGSINQTQFDWLTDQLANAGDKYVIVASHHTSWTMDASVGASEPFVNGPEVVDLLLSCPNVIAWVNGHTHRNEILEHTGPEGGFWEINTASHIDWPQQSRLVEILDNADGTLSLHCTMVDHGARVATKDYDRTMQLATLGRLLAANDPGKANFDGSRDNEKRRGTLADRNVELLIKAPTLVS